MKINTITKLSALLILASALVNTTSAAGPAFMKLGDIKGKATDTDHKDWIILESHTEEQTRDSDSGAIVTTIRIKRKTDASSVALVRAFLDGTRFSGGAFVAAGDVNGVAEMAQSETLPPFSIAGYSRTTGGVDDGMEEFVFEVQREEEQRGLLLPAVQKVRKAAASASTETEGSDVLLRQRPLNALLLPAVQKVREAAAR